MWKNITITENNIEAWVGNSCIIKCPNNSEYKGFMFYHPSKCVRSKGKCYSVGYTDNFTFKLFKKGNGKYNKFETIAEKQIDASDFEEMFGVISDNLKSKSDESYVEITEPKKITKEVAVKEDLKNE